jgi:hypothetical protein
MLNNKSQSLNGIAMFPLDIVVLPGELRYLHIFEERYKNLYNDVQKKGGYFVIPFYFQGKVFETGSLVYIEKTLNMYKSGEIDISIRGADIINVLNYHKNGAGRGYPTGDVRVEQYESMKLGSRVINSFNKYLKLMNYDTNGFSGDAFSLMRFLKLSDVEKFYILRIKSNNAFNRTLINYINLKTVLLRQYSSLGENYSLN